MVPLWIAVVRHHEPFDEPRWIAISAHQNNVRLASRDEALHDSAHVVHSVVQHHGSDAPVTLRYRQHRLQPPLGAMHRGPFEVDPDQRMGRDIGRQHLEQGAERTRLTIDPAPRTSAGAG